MRLDIDLIKPNFNVFFTSDFHLFHQNIIRFDSRPFSDLSEMHEEIIKGWNEKVSNDDIVIYLGDISFHKGRDEDKFNEILNRLNGKIYYIIGNHDNFDKIKNIKRFEKVVDYLEVRIKHITKERPEIKETLFCCMHYPIYVWNKCHHGSYMIHGHSHMSLSEDDYHKTRRIFDVGCNGSNYRPISYLELIEIGEKIDYRIIEKHH